MAGTSSASTADVKSQYHHYVPRFILKNFAHLKPFSDGGKNKRNKNRTEHMVHCINLSGTDAEIDETPVAKTFGVIDMYRDLSNVTRQHQIEEQLSVLESRAGEVISNIRNTFEAGKSDIWITRNQRDILRKFLFIMKYRGETAHKRHFHIDGTGYTDADRETFLNYMKEKGFKKPRDVWFDNLKAILDLKMDAKMEWMEKLRKRMYPLDAEWFINNTQQFYMAICTPETADDEFLLTQNAYSMHEGPVSQSVDLQTGEMKTIAYTEFHLFAPISPKLIFVLRSFILSSSIDDTDRELDHVRKAFFEASKAQHNFPERFESMLEDLPIAKASNSYSKIVDGKAVAVNGGMKGATDKFCLRFFPISETHVDKINSLMLEESYKISAIVFKSKTRIRKTLGRYVKDTDKFNELDPIGDARRLECVNKLNQALVLLGGPVEQSTSKQLPTSGPTQRPPVVSTDQVFDLFSKNQNMTSLYNEISLSKALNPRDFDEARRLLYLRIKLDSTTRILSQERRQKMRRNFLNIYERHPLQVVWIYLKRIRFMKLGATVINSREVIEDSNLPEDELGGLEDFVARERDRFRRKDLCRVMHYASFNGLLLKRLSPPFGLAGQITLDDNDLKLVKEEKELVLGDQGSICGCGIPDLEKRAKELCALVKAKRLYEQPKSPFDKIFSDEDKIEMATRALLRPEFESLVKGAMELETVIFGIVYPKFGFRIGLQVEEENADGGRTCIVQ